MNTKDKITIYRWPYNIKRWFKHTSEKIFCQEQTLCYPVNDLSFFILCIIKYGMLFMKGSHGADHLGKWASFLQHVLV